MNMCSITVWCDQLCINKLACAMNENMSSYVRKMTYSENTFSHSVYFSGLAFTLTLCAVHHSPLGNLLMATQDTVLNVNRMITHTP